MSAAGFATAAILVASVGCPRVLNNCYEVTNLVSNGTITADHTDANLVNGWGVGFSDTSYAWVANNGSGTSTLYDGNGNPQTLVVTVPSATGIGTGTPTGIVFNDTDSFEVSNDTVSEPALWIFVSQDGAISGWNPAVDATNAVLAVYGEEDDPIYTGVALASTDEGDFLFAADFRNQEIDVFDGAFTPTTTTGGFVGSQVPDDYAPFNVAYLNGLVYVAYAQQNETGDEEVAGEGLGYISTFTTDGVLVDRLVQNEGLNAPWAMAIAPAEFGAFSNNLLVGNFGDGTISAYRVSSGTYRGQLEDEAGDPIVIDGLWGFAFGNGANDQPATTLYFAAGPDDEVNGLYGSIVVCP